MLVFFKLTVQIDSMSFKHHSRIEKKPKQYLSLKGGMEPNTVATRWHKCLRLCERTTPEPCVTAGPVLRPQPSMGQSQ